MYYKPASGTVIGLIWLEMVTTYGFVEEVNFEG